ncbi:MAG: hypothetical protein AVDCRST_MAG29-1082 [uncultured Nocardioidaceae bacterium]|uniref:Uncharacterized protein n=1 Tax=uncultured Nocardioidaceae bacterium TaxID=253824 RepID=A0A6J4LGH2_9ACTN|nr:MAG: hypothetical protein AVDCRST_MAG29-1082 [uncultured Nocardioidaceae bacterium]
MQSTIKRAVGAVASVSALTGLCLVSGPASSAAVSVAQAERGTLTRFGFDATAYGSKADGVSGTESDPTAVSHLPCTSYVPRERENHVANSDRGGIQTNNVDTRNFTRQRDGVTSATSIATVQGGSMAGGAVRFTDLKARNVSFHKVGDGFRVKQFSSVGSLSVNGIAVPVPDNGRTTEVAVPGQGTLILNDKSRQVTAKRAFGVVNALKFVETNGRVQRTAHAQSNIDRLVESGVFQGGAWGSQSVVANTATSRRGAYQPMPCRGTFGETLETSTGESTEAGGTLGARRSYAYGIQRDSGYTDGFTRSVVDTANFGVLELRNIRGRANVTRQADGDLRRNARGTGVGEILIAGEAQPQPPAGEAQQFPGGEYTIRVVRTVPSGIHAEGALVRLFNGTRNDRTDDTVVHLAVAKLALPRG